LASAQSHPRRRRRRAAGRARRRRTSPRGRVSYRADLVLGTSSRSSSWTCRTSRAAKAFLAEPDGGCGSSPP
jgi:hypothetical protein